MSYTLHRVLGKLKSVKRNADGAFIPAFATTNADWEEFLTWNNAQQTPLSLEDTDPTQAELDAQQLAIDSAVDRANIRNHANNLLNDIAAGMAACDVDIADAASDATNANNATTLAQAKAPLVSCCQNIGRLATRQKRMLEGLEDIIKFLRRIV